MNKDESERITKSTKENAVGILSEGFITLTKGIQILDQISREEITLISEGDNINYLQKALELYNIKNVGFIRGIEGKSGSEQLKTLFDFFIRIPHDKKIIFIWDCDKMKYSNLNRNANTIPFVFECNTSNSIAKKGIENLFSTTLFDGFNKKITTSHGQEITEFDEKRKKDFMNFILSRNKKEDFVNFSPLLNFISEDTLELCNS